MKSTSLVLLLLAIAATTSLSAADAKSGQRAPDGKWRPGDMSRPRPPVVAPSDWGSNEKPAAPPSDAIVLFDGTSLDKWKGDAKKADAPADDSAKWKVENGYFEIVPKTGGIRTREKFKGDYQWHIEWATPAEVKGSSQGRGNSGVFIGGLPEVQVLDSFENDTYPDGQASSLYNQHPPYVNASRKPGQWQTYDIIVERAKLDDKGQVTQKARLTVIHNGIIVHHARELETKVQEGDLSLQDHSNPVRFRNIWLRKLNNDESANTPPSAPKQ